MNVLGRTMHRGIMGVLGVLAMVGMVGIAVAQMKRRRRRQLLQRQLWGKKTASGEVYDKNGSEGARPRPPPMLTAHARDSPPVSARRSLR